MPGGPIKGFVFTNNLLHHNTYGIFGVGQGYGNVALAYYAPGGDRAAECDGLGQEPWRRSILPTINSPTLAVYNANFLNAAVQDYRLRAGSAYRGASLDGRDLGCDFGVLPAQAPPAPPNNIHVGQ